MDLVKQIKLPFRMNEVKPGYVMGNCLPRGPPRIVCCGVWGTEGEDEVGAQRHMVHSCTLKETTA